jgi:DNA polymerase-3 subunit delta
MNNIYLLYGIDKTLIDNKINEIKKKVNINEFDIIKYDMNTDSLDSVINEISMPSLFSNTKLLLVNNSTFFSSGKNIDTTELEKCLEHISKSIYIIFTCNVEKIDSRKKICKLIEKQGMFYSLYNYSNK